MQTGGFLGAIRAYRNWEYGTRHRRGDGRYEGIEGSELGWSSLKHTDRSTGVSRSCGLRRSLQEPKGSPPMTPLGGQLYEFIFRGELAKEALDKAGTLRRNLPQGLDPALAQRLSLGLLDQTLVEQARAMAVVYAAVAAFENS